MATDSENAAAVVAGAKMNDTNLPTVEQLLEAADRKVEELERAIFCLPKPPEGMGDGPDERVANVIFLLQKARGKRAEVLAACVNKVETTIYYREVDVLEWDAARLQQQIANDIRQLQPAAKDLEELLRQEWNKAIEEAWQFYVHSKDINRLRKKPRAISEEKP